MNISLVQPDYSEIYKDIGEPVYEPPLGLAYISSYLESHGHQTQIFDMIFPNQRVKFYRSLSETDIVGITCTTPLYGEAKELLRRLPSHIITVLGGPHMTATKDTDNLADHIVLGEGESAMLDIANRNRHTAVIQGIPIESLDNLPFPARERLDLGKYKITVPSGDRGLYSTCMTARGCPHHCIFCDAHKTFGRRTRFRSPQNVYDEFELCVNEYGIHNFGLLDDTATLDQRRWMKICDMIIDDDLEVNYHCATRVDSVSRELLQKMKDSGCYRVHIGCESGNQDILDSAKKGITLQQIEKAFKLCDEVGISTYAYFMLGLPGETEETARQTVDFAIKIDPDFFQYTIAMPFPGTDLYQWVKENKLFIEDLDYDNYKWYGNPVFEENIHTDRLIELQKDGYKRYYQRPRYILKKLRKPKEWISLIKSFIKFRRFTK